MPLSLFNDSVSEALKAKVSKKIIESECLTSCAKRKGTGFGKPIFPEVTTESNCDLSDFAGSDCWAFFRILRINPEFLHLPVNEWVSNQAFLHGKEVVAALCVVNDAAERGVKLCHDFLGSSKKESNLQNVLQVVENSRGRLPNQRKRKLESKRWFLKLE